jgi:membrane-bound serine protease (ClpP class)
LRRACVLTLALLAVGATSLVGQPIAQPVSAIVDPGWADALVHLVTNPLVAPLLLALGLLGLVFEIKHGAFGLGLVLSLLSLGVFFASNFLLGLAGWQEVLLLGLGLLAMLVEIFVIPGFGIAGVLAIVAFGAAIVMAMLGTAPTTGDIVKALAVLGASLVITASVGYAWLRHLPTSTRFAGLFLRHSAPQPEGYISALPRGDLVGLDGIAVTDLRPAGTAQIGSERVDVVTEGEYVPQGTAIRVTRSEGYRHIVRGIA